MENQYKEYLLVDGYNIINAWPELNNEMKKVNLESARDKLIDIMADYSASMAISVVVVFDAHQVDKSRRTRYRINGVDVIYTKVGETADHYIEKVVDAIGRETRVRVATSDWIEQQIILGRGASRISAREFYEEIKQLRTARQNKEKKCENLMETIADIIDPKLIERIEKDIKHKRK
ncbi:MAG TPA: NYN domain-containing protein [Thermoanaerobacterales bacterium]|nr:NYN domain-containing protein [Thermoanaerobacterales bacterium]